MKNKNIYIILVFMLIAVSCTKELDKINRNPNATEHALPDYLLTSAIKTSVDTYWGVENNMNSSLLFVQHWAKIQYTEQDRYIFSNSSFTSLWNTGFSKSITALNEVIKHDVATTNANYKGVALVFRSWVFLLLTDAYGDIPYSQAGAIDSFVTPKFDSQKDVYFGLLRDLAQAQKSLDASGKPVLGDILYKGDILQWKKFANSLRLRIALRIADKEPARAQQEITELWGEGANFLSGNNDNAQLIYLSSPNQNPVNALFETRNDYRVSKTLADALIKLHDPRLPVFVSKTETATSQEYVGVPNGLTTSDASNLGFSKTSKPGEYFRQPSAPAVILNYSEVLFNRAEAAARGFTTENAAVLYEQAVKASFEQFGISNETAATYLLQQQVKFNPANFKESIGLQKWIALYGQGLEAFAEWRRLDYPHLSPAVAGVLNGKIPQRFIYPGTEQSLNGKNYREATGHQGADVLTTKLWFDTR